MSVSNLRLQRLAAPLTGSPALAQPKAGEPPSYEAVCRKRVERGFAQIKSLPYLCSRIKSRRSPRRGKTAEIGMTL